MESPGTVLSNWFIALTKHYGDAFFIANEFSQRGNQSLEITALGKQGLLIVDLKNKLSDAEKKSLLGSFAPQMEKQLFIDDLSESVIKSYLSLNNAKVEKYLLFFEFGFLGEALECAQDALSKGLNIVELRLIRSRDSVTHLILTGDSEEKAKELCQKYSTLNVKLLSHPSEEIKKYFEIFPA